MIILKDTIEIKASPEQIVDFFLHFKDNFHAWHPDHVECRYLTPGPLKEGSVIYIEEYIGGRLVKVRLHITKIEPRRLECKVSPYGSRSIYIMEPKGDKTLLTTEMHMGTKIPLLGRIVDKIIKGRAEALKRHLAEEGQNLKRILEEGI